MSQSTNPNAPDYNPYGNDPEVQRQKALNDEMQRQIALMKEKAASQPVRPDYASLLDKDGNLPAGYQLKPDYTSAAYDQLKDRALGNKRSPWLDLMLGQNKLARSNMLQQGAASATSGAAGALSTLARTGGYTGGARERIAKDAARSMMMSGQDASRTMAGNNLTAMTQDANTNTDLTKYVSGVDLDRSKTTMAAGQFNIKNQMDEVMAKRAADLKVYEEQMKQWAANRTAEATENSGK